MKLNLQDRLKSQGFAVGIRIKSQSNCLNKADSRWQNLAVFINLILNWGLKMLSTRKTDFIDLCYLASHTMSDMKWGWKKENNNYY